MTQSDAVAIGRDLLVAVLDRIIPAGDGFPSAGEIASDYVARVVASGGVAAPLFSEIEQSSLRHGNAGFTYLSDAPRDSVMKEIEASHAASFEALVVSAYAGYYSDPSVIGLLGLDPRPPQPRGHEMEPLNLRLLDQVRLRKPIYRET
jgi:hypothetical protein